MQKLSGTISGKNNTGCGIFHNETNKIEVVGFYKNQLNGFTI
jgi:hypothetical protein